MNKYEKIVIENFKVYADKLPGLMGEQLLIGIERELRELGQFDAVVMPPPNAGREEQAVRLAINNFEEWHSVTDIPPKHSTYYYEVLACIEDAAKIGFGVAHDQDLETIKTRLDK